MKQVKYTELLGSGHYVAVDKADVFLAMLKEWLAGLGERDGHITKEKILFVEE